MNAETKTPTTSQTQIDRRISILDSPKRSNHRSASFAPPTCSEGRALDLSTVFDGEPPSGSTKSNKQPPTRPVIAAAIILTMAKGQPKKETLTKTESIPVCGVLIKKPRAAPLLAPCWCKPIPAGMTPHEQSGRGTPSKTALRTPE